MQATQTRSRLEVFYRSLSRPDGEERIIAPHTLVYSGQRWHVRAWCEKRRAFRDFVLTRMAPGAELLGEALESADPVLDANWQNQILVRLGPNPGLSPEQQRLVALDYGMDREQELKVPVRRALAHYLLQSLNVSWGGGSSAKEQPLVLVNPEDVEPYVFAD